MIFIFYYKKSSKVLHLLVVIKIRISFKIKAMLGLNMKELCKFVKVDKKFHIP